MEIKDILRLLQTISGKTQVELASILGVSHPSFNNWYTGKSQPREKHKKEIKKLLDSYNIDISFVENTKSGVDIKKEFILQIAQKYKNVINLIHSRSDIIDELSLYLTYNSNAIEGSTLTMEDTANVIFHKKTFSNKTLDEQLEAQNHDKAFRYLISHLHNDGDISESFAIELHKILMSGIRDDAGTYRDHAVRIAGSYVPTANYLKIPILMSSLFKRELDRDIIKYVSYFHADFEKIHPFSDGNGRVGRLLIIGLLLKNNIMLPIILKKKRPEYYKSLQKAQLEEDYGLIEEFIIDAIIYGYKILEE